MAASAGTAGTGDAGQAAVGGMRGDSGSSDVTSGDAGTVNTGGDAGQMNAEGGDAGAGGAVEPPASGCLPSATRSCAESGLLGSCAAGSQSCGSDGKWGSCSITPTAKDTCVTGNDDSCNGVANEGCGCVIGAERPCDGAKGNCANGKQTCPDGTWSACSIAPKAQDACTPGDDANCNGTPNEGCACENGAVQACGPAAVGICKPGKSTCSGGAWGACVGAVVAAARDCRSAADNDCNGSPDNTIDGACACHPSDQQACGTHPGLDGKGICHAGSQTCNAASNNSSSSWGSCSGGVGPSSRNCSSAADNDCNGTADNTVDSVCQCGSACPVDTVCKNLTSSSQCVACQSNTDCKNGGTCNTTAGTCSCSSRYNGKTCRFLAFRGIGVLANDVQSYVNGISRDGTVVVGNSSGAGASLLHAVRSVDGAPLQFIPELSSVTPDEGCEAQAVDSSGTVFGYCEYGYYPFQYTPATMSVAIDTGSYTFAPLADVSQDGSVIVGYLSPQAYRRTSQGVTALGLLEPGGQSHATAVSGDGAIVIGWDSSGSNDAGWIWRSSTGITPLPKLAAWIDYDAWDVSTDGKVIVGSASDGNCVKWTGTPLSASVVTSGECLGTNQDGSVMVGNVGNSSLIAMVWNGAAHNVADLLGATPDLAGWTLTTAVAVSDDGKYAVGNGTNTAGGAHSEGWVAHLP